MKLSARVFILCLLFMQVRITYCSAQREQAKIDSMLKMLPLSKEDTNKVNLLTSISGRYNTVDPDEGIKYGLQALALAQELGWKRGIAGANTSLGSDYQYKSDYPKAFEYDFKALHIYEESRDKRGVANLTRNIATIYQYEKIYTKVLEYELKALKIFEEIDDKQGISSTLSNIGIYYFFQHDYHKALEYDFKALKICQDNGLLSNVAAGLGNVGDAYLHLGDYANALEYSFKSLSLFEQLGDKYGRAIDLGNIGEIYLAAAKDSTRSTTTDSVARFGKTANLRRAIVYLDKSISASKEIDQLDNIIEFSEYLSEAYELSGKYKEALAFYKQYTKVNDSVYSADNSMKIKQSEHIHELELKDKDIQIAKLAVAKKQNERVLFIAGICLLLIIIGIVLKNFISQKETNKLLKLEKKRSDDLLLNILPEEVANELKATGGAAVKHFEHVSVLFTDFVNFTEAGERMSPEQLIDELHICFKAFDGIIDKYNIEKIKTIGDAYLAVAGLPVEDPGHAEHIVKAAIDINTFMNNRREKIGNKTFEVRIGIHSGSVVAGIVGVKKFAYDIWGDTVNTASRMEQNSEPGKINISEVTYELVKDKFVCTFRGEIAAKNKGNMKMYFVS
jgi:adenylate cyclase